MNIFTRLFSSKSAFPNPIENSFHRMILSSPRVEKKYFSSKSTLNIYATMDNVRRKKLHFLSCNLRFQRYLKMYHSPSNIYNVQIAFFTLAVDWCPNNSYTENHLKASTTTKEHVY